MPESNLWVRSGIVGVLSVVSFILAVAVPWPETQAGTSSVLIVVSAWPILGIVYSYGLYSYVAAERESSVNRLAFVFSVVAFTTVLAMIIVQLAIGAGIGEITEGLDEQTATALRRGLRMIDLGLDVAWDLLIGTTLILWGAAIRKRRGFGPGWALPTSLFGILLIALNAATFPWPPANRGLFDIGPFIALFMMAMAARLALLGRRARAEEAAPRSSRSA